VGDDRAILAELMRSTEPGEPIVLRHYLYFQTEADAELAASELRRRGLRIEVRLSADGVNRLVLACHEITSSGERILAVRESMSALVRECGGEYDGWEAEVR
jgi:hypothetical protein